MATPSVHLRKIKRPAKHGRVRYEWHLRWHGSDGRHHCVKIGDCATMTKREAEALRRRRQAEMDSDTEASHDNNVNVEPITLAQFADVHASMISRDRKPSTLYEFRLSLRLATAVFGEGTPIHAITPADVGKLKAALRGSPATRAKHLSRLRAMFNHAKRWGLLAGDNPFANQPMPRFGARSMRIFSSEEIEAMLTAAPTLWWRAFLLVAITAGPRKEEILNLLWRDIDLEKRTIAITAKKAESFTAADGQHYETLAWNPKTYAMRMIPIPDRTVAALKEFKAESDGSPYLFVSLERLGHINVKMREGTWRDRAETCNNVLRDFQKIQRSAAEALGRADWRIGTIHDLRRTYGSRMADVVPMHALQRWMGHSDVSVTAGFYLGLSDQHAEKAREAFV